MDITRELPGSTARSQKPESACTARESQLRKDDSHFEMSRWWFVASIFPTIAGTLGPVALAFSICSLGRPWVQHTSSSTNMDEAAYVSDPGWLTSLKAIQLILAVVSNMFLLFDLTRKIRFTIAQPITIIGWYISAVCLVCLHAIATGPLLDSLGLPIDETIWSQAFYYGIWAAILYFLNASLLVISFWGAVSGYCEKDYNLGRSQRTLMLQTMMFLTFLLLGAIIFSNIENWNFLDGVYWADVTLFTIGFGDFAPTTVLGRALMIPYVLIGVTSLGLVIASIRSIIIERGGQRLDARTEEKSRRKELQKIMRKGKGDMLSPFQQGPNLEDVSASEFERRRSEFELMRTIKKRASSQRRWTAMIISTVSWLCLWLCGAVVFHRCEKTTQGWTYFEAVYFCFISLTTIGYGDLVPSSNAGKSFFVFWSLIALPILTILISNAGDTVVRLFDDITIRFGNITLLPGRGGIGHNFKQLVHQLSCGQLYSGLATDADCDSEQGIAQPSETSDLEKPKFKGKEVKRSVNSHSNPEIEIHQLETAGSSYIPKLQATSPGEKLSYNLPTGDDLHLLLISEIQAVARHVRETKRRRYSFEEWAWYLRLIGENESDPEVHAKEQPKKPTHWGHLEREIERHGQHDVDENHIDLGQQSSPGNTERIKWSWVGNQSPLLGGQEESVWICQRLMERLRELLWITREQRNQTGQELA